MEGTQVSRKQFIQPFVFIYFFFSSKNQLQMMEATDFLSFRVMCMPEDTTEAHEHMNSFCLKFEETGGEQRQTGGLAS